MTIDINKTKIDLFANIDKMATPSKNKKVVGKPYKVVTLNNVGGNGFIIMKCYYTQFSNIIELELKLKRDDFCHRVVGKATDYGYHRESAALQDALDNLNITLFDNDAKQQFIDGRGDGIMLDALLAIAKSSNWDTVIMNEVYL